MPIRSPEAGLPMRGEGTAFWVWSTVPWESGSGGRVVCDRGEAVMEVVLGNFVDLGLRVFFGEGLTGVERVSRGNSWGERSELISMLVSEAKAQEVHAYELCRFLGA